MSYNVKTKVTRNSDIGSIGGKFCEISSQQESYLVLGISKDEAYDETSLTKIAEIYFTCEKFASLKFTLRRNIQRPLINAS